MNKKQPILVDRLHLPSLIINNNDDILSIDYDVKSDANDDSPSNNDKPISDYFNA